MRRRSELCLACQYCPAFNVVKRHRIPSHLAEAQAIHYVRSLIGSQQVNDKWAEKSSKTSSGKRSEELGKTLALENESKLRAKVHNSKTLGNTWMHQGSC